MKGLTLIYSLFLLMLLGSCKQQDQPWENEEVAMVSFALSSPVDADSRGNVSTYPKDPLKWNDNEKLADGRYFKDITVMILKDNVLQAFEERNVTDKSAQVEISFDATFNAGTYTLMAVANYTHLNDFKTLLEGFKEGNKSYSELMSYRLSAGDDDGLMDSETVQPLTLIKEINLHPGQNQISGEMLRTYSRIRIEVRNQSDIYDLVVNGISFSDNFAQNEAFIWPGQGYLPYSRVAIDVDSDDALTPFTQSVTIPKMTASGGTTTVNSAVVFDAYILESEETDAGKKYTYTLDLSYGGGQGGGQTTVPEGPLKDVTSIRNYSTNTFLIQNLKSDRFLYELSSFNTLLQSEKEYDKLRTEVETGKNTQYLWTLEPYGTLNNYYRIKNKQSNRYIGKAINWSQVQLSSEQGEHYFKFYNYSSTSSDSNSQAIQMQYQGQGGSNERTCLNDTYSNDYLYGGFLDAEDGGTKFVFYCIGSSGSNSGSSSDTGLNKIQTIDLRTINKETARPEDVRGIKRNDFINALVTVTYNETFGQFEFEVEDWNQAGGDITFN